MLIIISFLVFAVSFLVQITVLAAPVPLNGAIDLSVRSGYVELQASSSGQALKAPKGLKKRKRRKTPKEKRAAIEKERQELAEQERERKAKLEAQWKKEEKEKKQVEKYLAYGRKLAAAEDLASDTIHTKNENDARQIRDNLDQARVVYHKMSAMIKGKGKANIDTEKET